MKRNWKLIASGVGFLLGATVMGYGVDHGATGLNIIAIAIMIVAIVAALESTQVQDDTRRGN